MTNVYDNNVSVINTTSNTVKANVNVGISPHGVAASPDGTNVYVANDNSNNVSVINISSKTVINSIEGKNGAWGVAISPDGTKLYVGTSDPAVAIINTNSKPTCYLCGYRQLSDRNCSYTRWEKSRCCK